MGQVNTYEKTGEAGEPDNCTYCGKQLKIWSEFYPHEFGGYCIFAPRNETDYACQECSFKDCESCGKKLMRFAFIECEKCEQTHCFNNTDMIYKGNHFLEPLGLCDKRFCCPDGREVF